MSYKVWVSVEEIDEDNDRYEDVGLPDSLGEFSGLDEADEFVRMLLCAYNPEAMEHSDRNNTECRKLYTEPTHANRT